MLNTLKNRAKYNFIASSVLNRPLALEPGAAAVVLDALAGRLGVMPIGAFEEYGAEPVEAREAVYEVVEGVAIIPVIGELVQRGAFVGAASGLTSYQALVAMCRKAASDPVVKGALLDMDTPGGECAGMLDAADQIAAAFADAKKPLWAFSNERMFSAGYAIGCVADRILVSRASGVGSIGVIVQHVDRSQADEKEGLKVTTLFAGKTKADGIGSAPLSSGARGRTMDLINKLYDQFTAHVAAYRGLSQQDIKESEAMCFYGDAAVAEGLADGTSTFEEALISLIAHTQDKDAKKNTASKAQLKKRGLSMSIFGKKQKTLGAKSNRPRMDEGLTDEDEEKREELARKRAALKAAKARQMAVEEEDETIEDEDDEVVGALDIELENEEDEDETIGALTDDEIDEVELEIAQLEEEIAELEEELEEEEDVSESARKAARKRSKSKTPNKAVRSRDSMRSAADIAQICASAGYPEMTAGLLRQGASVADAHRAVRANSQIKRMISASAHLDPSLADPKLQRAIISKAAGNVQAAQSYLFKRVTKAASAATEITAATSGVRKPQTAAKVPTALEIREARAAAKASALGKK